MSSAHKFIHKSSDVAGERPSRQQLDPGEIGINNDPTEPGLFTRTSEGNVIKIGPTIVSGSRPNNLPELGESWLDLSNGNLKVGSVEEAKKVWKTIAAPFMGGGERVVFVATEFPHATDALGNNGQSLPYKTINRGLLELTKIFIQDTLTKGELERNTRKYTLFLAPSLNTPNNAPGSEALDFDVTFPDDSTYEPTVAELVKFNSPSGGLITPSNFSIIGMDTQKCELRPSYVPSYKHPGLPPELAGDNEPPSAIFKVGLRTYLDNFSVSDKISSFEVTKVTSVDTDVALLHCLRPHGISRPELCAFSYFSNFDRQSRSFKEGVYLVEPVSPTTCKLINPDSDSINPQLLYVQYSSLVPQGTSNEFKLTGSQQRRSAHRLRAISNASLREFAEFFVKVQAAYLTFFGGKIVQGSEILLRSQVKLEEYVDPKDQYSFDLFSNLHLSSDYGMCGGEVNGNEVGAQFSLKVQNSSVDSIQTDPAAYEVYTTILDSEGNPIEKWWPLIRATYESYPLGSRPESIKDTPIADQIAFLSSTPVERIRYYYGFSKTEAGKTLGVPDPDNDFRHFGIKIKDQGIIYADNFSCNAPIGKWGVNGGTVIDTNSESTFGSQALRAEGFRGMGTISGAEPNLKGFQFSGVYCPLALTRQQTENTGNKKILSLGGRIVSITIDPEDPGIQLVKLSCAFFPSYILPYSLKPNTAVWVRSGGCTYRGFLATDGKPTVKQNNENPCPTGAILRIRLSDSTIPTDNSVISSFDIPYIRRFEDPRRNDDRCYRLVLSNTNPDAVAPSVGNILRLDQTSAGLGNPKVRPNVQFDPGALGGWARVFSVNDVNTELEGNSPNFNYVVSDNVQSTNYLVTLSTVDDSRPWIQGEDNQAGSLVTHNHNNWYSAENNIWETVYHDTAFTEDIGPNKVAPSESNSPFVKCSVIERQEPVDSVFQGSYGGDPLVSLYPENAEYMRGYTTPFTQYYASNSFDYDDGSESLGLVLKRKVTGYTTNLVSPIDEGAIVQTEVLASGANRYRPEIVTFQVLSTKFVVQPRQNISIIKLSKDGVTEYFQIIGLTGSSATAIRLNSRNSPYPDPAQVGQWESGTVVHICDFDSDPESGLYDPDWNNSRKSMLRFFEVMGYSASSLGILRPRYWGERKILMESLPPAPDLTGYALETSNWDFEFNEPSTVIAIAHSWNSCGYLTASRGLRNNRKNTLSRKLGYDFMAYALWGGSIIANGSSETGEQISLGPQREGLTSRFLEPISQTINVATQQVYEEQPYVEFPNQVVVYATDNISESFNGENITFPLTKGGLPIPLSQLKQESMFVQLGTVTQRPGVDYWLSGDYIVFKTPPKSQTMCDIRVMTTEDAERTMVVATMEMQEAIDDSRSAFTLISESDIRLLDIDYNNLLVFMGGVLQSPESAYFLTRDSSTQLTIAFTEPIPVGTTPDIRAICTNNLWAAQGIFPVTLYSLDSLAQEFDNAETKFVLKYQSEPLNPSVITSENCLVSLGGVIQTPGYSYTVKDGIIEFTEAPPVGTTSEIRVISNAHFLPCLNSRGKTESFLWWGPSVVLSLENDLRLMQIG